MSELANALPTLDYSVVVPAFNEVSSNIRRDAFLRNLDELLEHTSKTGSSYEVIVVDDGSDDGTADVAESFNVNVIRAEHRGKGGAIKQGFEVARGEVKAFADADGAISPQSVIRLIDRIRVGGDADIAVIRRSTDENQSLLRSAGHSALERLCNYFAPTDVRDTQAGAKAFSKRAAELIWPNVSTEGFAADRHALHIAHVIGLRVAEIDTPIANVGDSHIRMLKDGYEMLRDSYRIKHKVIRLKALM